MPFVTFTVRRGLSTADKSRLSEAMLEAQVAAGYHQADRFHRFLEVDEDDLPVDPRYPDCATDRTDRFMVVEVVISRGRPTGRRHHCRRSGQTVRRAPAPRASGRPVCLPRGGTEPPALSCCVDRRETIADWSLVVQFFALIRRDLPNWLSDSWPMSLIGSA